MRITNMSLLTAAVALLTTAALIPVAHAEAESPGFKAGDILIRGRVVGVLPSVSSSVSTIGGNVDASNTVIPEIDVSYFFTQNISAELIGAITRHHTQVKDSALGTVDLGHVSLVPPTLTAQYHFLPTSRVNPYLGAGINYTMFFDDNVPSSGPVHTIHYDNAFGAAIQAGVDVNIQGNWYANLDVKHLFLQTDVNVNGSSIKANVNLDPTIVGMGIGYKF